jgi:hypothetical protein
MEFPPVAHRFFVPGWSGMIFPRRPAGQTRRANAGTVEAACVFARLGNTRRVNEKFAAALRRFDEANAHDPHRENGRPRELVYAERLTHWVLKLCPAASEPLRLAARCQHLRRWESPRENYPATRAGYLKWRADLKQFHAEKAGAILRETGCDDETIRRVQDLNLKKNFPADPEVRVLEDALCLVFLEFQFAALAAKSDDEKMINAVRKSWAKMTEAARAEALKLNFGAREKLIIAQALKAA